VSQSLDQAFANGSSEEMAELEGYLDEWYGVQSTRDAIGAMPIMIKIC